MCMCSVAIKELMLWLLSCWLCAHAAIPGSGKAVPHNQGGGDDCGQHLHAGGCCHFCMPLLASGKLAQGMTSMMSWCLKGRTEPFLCAQLVSKPQQFDVMVTPNLYGNLVSNVVGPLSFLEAAAARPCPEQADWPCSGQAESATCCPSAESPVPCAPLLLCCNNPPHLADSGCSVAVTGHQCVRTVALVRQ